MRRGLGLATGIVIAVLAVVLLAGRHGGRDSFEVDAVFDTARGMVPGQVVKIAGTRVGTVDGMSLQRRADGTYQARMTMSISSRFRPFHRDASCRILPEGLISENYVECSPGRAAGALRAGRSGRPTIDVGSTSASVTLQDVLDTFSLPVDKRITLFLDSLGIGTAGRGDDINAILRRANPALEQARSALAVLGRQNDRISKAVKQTDTVLAHLAARDQDVRGFVRNAAHVSRTTGARARALGATIRNLPPMLEALRDGLRSVRQATDSGGPLLDDLREAAPQLVELTHRVPAVARSSAPALRSLGRAARVGTAAVPVLRPVIRHMRQLAAQTPETTRLLRDLLVSSRNRGAIDGLWRFMYGSAAFTGPYDGLSHVVGLGLSAFPDCIAQNAADKPGPGCSHAYSAKNLGRVPVNAPNVDPGPDNSAALNSVGRSEPTARTRPISGRHVHDLLDFLLK